MKDLSINLLRLFLVWAITVFILASCGRFAYPKSVHPHGELALAGYKDNIGAYSPHRAFFMRNISMRSHFMVKLERDIFICAGSCVPVDKPFSALPPNYLVVIGRASLSTQGAH